MTLQALKRDLIRRCLVLPEGVGIALPKRRHDMIPGAVDVTFGRKVLDHRCPVCGPTDASTCSHLM